MRSSRTTLAALGLGTALAASATGLVLLTGSPATAQEASSAFGVSATGVDPVGAQPSVSSSGEAKTGAAGSIAGKAGTFTATGLSVKASLGLAEATVANVVVGGHSIGSVSARCADGATSYTGGGPSAPAENLRVSYGGGAGATITVLGAGGRAVEVITVAVVSCGTSTPPPTHTPTGTPTGQATGTPTGTSTGQATGTAMDTPTGQATGTSQPEEDHTPDQPAPDPTPIDGHHPVTG